MIISFLTLAYLMGPVVTATVDSHSVAVIVASQIRRQGFLCEDPISTQRVAADSAPIHTVYFLKCQVSAYRVVLVPYHAAVFNEVK